MTRARCSDHGGLSDSHDRCHQRSQACQRTEVPVAEPAADVRVEHAEGEHAAGGVEGKARDLVRQRQALRSQNVEVDGKDGVGDDRRNAKTEPVGEAPGKGRSTLPRSDKYPSGTLCRLPWLLTYRIAIKRSTPRWSSKQRTKRPERRVRG